LVGGPAGIATAHDARAGAGAWALAEAGAAIERQPQPRGCPFLALAGQFANRRQR